MKAVVGPEHNDRAVGTAAGIQRVKQFAHHRIGKVDACEVILHALAPLGLLHDPLVALD
jgi:hypothetical protein